MYYIWYYDQIKIILILEFMHFSFVCEFYIIYLIYMLCYVNNIDETIQETDRYPMYKLQNILMHSVRLMYS